MEEQKTVSAEQPKKDADTLKRKEGNTDWVATGLAAVALLVGGYGGMYAYKVNKGDRVDVPTVAVVDMERLNSAFFNQVMADNTSDPAATAEKLEAQSKLLVETVQRLSAEGKLVIAKSATLSYPSGNDVTEQVAQMMGVNLSAATVFPDGTGNTQLSAPLSQPQPQGSAGNASLD